MVVLHAQKDNHTSTKLELLITTLVGEEVAIDGLWLTCKLTAMPLVHFVLRGLNP